jgi:hypothetical protein
MLTLFAALVLLPKPTQADPRLEKAYRRDEAGWVYARLEGSPRDIGFQYGTLLAPEIVDAHAALKISMKRNTGKDWEYFRETSRRLFWDKTDLEFQQEMEGQAEALQAKGHKIDKWDVLAFNSHIEIEGSYLPWTKRQPSTRESCSAFVATGSATKDGRIVMGHNLWWDYLMGQRFNAILDITPAKGNRIVMDALCGFIHSGSDFAITSSGLMITETTISGFSGFDPKGIPEFVRMRKATQYANSLDEWVAIMKQGNNGGYANTWLLGDTETNEIGKLELGLKNVRFWRTKDGSYVGANFPEDPKLIAEEIPGGWNKDPRQNQCEQRRARWKTLLSQNQGTVDAEKAKAFLADTYDEILGTNRASGGTLCGRNDAFGYIHGATNTKVATSDTVGKMQFWARMGFSDGSTFAAGPFIDRHRQFEPLRGLLRDIPRQPWVLYTDRK